MPEDAAASSGRKIFNAHESILWTQRIEKEDRINGQASSKFSMRAAVSVTDVPRCFKPGHVNPAKEKAIKTGFDPTQHGWDPAGKEAQEFYRCIAMSEAGPRHRHAAPETSNQEHGWLLMPGGDAVARTRQKKLRNGIGWLYKTPDEWSESTAMAPPVPAAGVTEKDLPAASTLSAMPPSALSVVAPSDISAYRHGSGVPAPPPPASKISASAPAPPPQTKRSLSQVSAAPPSAVSAAAPSSVSRASSLPALNPAQRLQRQEDKLAKRWKESYEFQNKGLRGNHWYRPLSQTDATEFANEFMKATGGVPLHKFAKPLKKDA